MIDPVFMEIQVIAFAHNGHKDKFGIPRQSRDSSTIETHIRFVKPYSDKNCFRGLEAYSHLWLIWGFSEAKSWSPTVRPPRLGGNTRVGVFATRSPFRPNHLGLSSVRLIRIDPVVVDGESTVELVVSGADLLDGTPIYDIKPYLAYSDSHSDAECSFADAMKDYRLAVIWQTTAPAKEREALEEILSQDPRPAYQDDPERVYTLDYGRVKVHFRVDGSTLYVQSVAE